MTKPKTLLWVETVSDIFGRPRLHQREESPDETAERARIAELETRIRELQDLSRACVACTRDAQARGKLLEDDAPDPADLPAVSEWLRTLADLDRTRAHGLVMVARIDAQADALAGHARLLRMGAPAAKAE